ncbi:MULTISPECIES: peptidoglycan-binding protein [Kocuria]|nr:MULTISPECIES: peptidoglycan-binding protein [Kocuria]
MSSSATRCLTTRIATLLGAGAIVAAGFAGTVVPAHADQGAMIMPTSGKITGTTNGYCTSGSAHGGFDIAAPSGTTIRAAADGQVTFAGWGVKTAYSNPGYQVKLSHAGGWATDYRHMKSTPSVKAGQTVKKGQIIGYVGSTGNSTGPHLHLSITRNGATVRDASLVDDFKCGTTVAQSREISYSFPGLPKTAAPVTGVYPTLQQGASGPAVTNLQNLLNARGYSVTVDGSFGPQTNTAVRKFQGAIGATVDGQVGPKTWGALEARAAGATTLKQGSTGNDVRALQRSLNATMNANLAVDGNFGAATHTAVINYQKSRGLTADGVVGPQTWTALKGAR